MLIKIAIVSHLDDHVVDSLAGEHRNVVHGRDGISFTVLSLRVVMILVIIL